MSLENYDCSSFCMTLLFRGVPFVLRWCSIGVPGRSAGVPECSVVPLLFRGVPLFRRCSIIPPVFLVPLFRVPAFLVL